ncbi:MAG: zinc-dependent alcohol dehydrogenase [Actinomycetota bacterium]
MRQLVFVEPGHLEWREEVEPSLRDPGDALVRPVAAAACDLDGAVIRGLVPLPGPFPFGHEFVADVAEVGPAVSAFSQGQRVIVPFSISCGTCGHCTRGLTAHCSTVQRNAMYGVAPIGGDWGGAIADLVRVPFADHMLVPLPSGVESATVASASDNLPDAWRGVGPQLDDLPEASVLVVGGGAPSIGLYAAAIARALGASSVDYVDRDPERLRLAESFGANAIEGFPEERIGPYPITFDASAHPKGLRLAIVATEPGGWCTSAGIYYQPETPVPLLAMYDRGITFRTGRPHARPTIPRILDLVASGKLDPDPIATVVSWDEAPEAFREPPLKLILVRD